MNKSRASSKAGAVGASEGSGTASQVPDGTSPSPANDGPCPGFLKFLECDVLVDQLMQYLNFEEVKLFSLASKDVLTTVRRSRNFSERSSINIHKDLPSSGINLKDRFPFLWKRMSFDVSLPLGTVEQFAEKLNNVQSLVIYHGPREKSKIRTYNMSQTRVTHCLRGIQEVLKKTTNLRELTFNITFLKYPLEEIFSSMEVQQSIRNLESLSILNSHNEFSNKSMTQAEADHFRENFLQLSLCPLKLKKLKLELVGDWRSLSAHKLVEAHQETLEELKLDKYFWRPQEMESIVCPNLKRLTTSVNFDEIEFAQTFIENQPLLEELSVAFYTCRSIPTAFLNYSEGRFANLLKLEIEFFEVFDDDDGFGEEADLEWTFLDSMTKLEEFTVQLPEGAHGPEMIERLPKTVKKLNVSLKNGNKRNEDFWYCYPAREEGFTANIGDYLRRFEDLTHFSLLGFINGVNDAGLQTLIRTCPNLRELRFERCPNLTDFGISGVNENKGVSEREQGVPLSDLKELIGLEISKCDLLSAACVLDVIRFKSLRWFVFNTSGRREMQDKEQFVSRIREQNPSLVSFRHNGSHWDRNGLVSSR